MRTRSRLSSLCAPVAMFLLGASLHLSAQIFDNTSKNPVEQNSSAATAQVQQLLRPSIIDGPVDPKEYLVGPGDVYILHIWGDPTPNYPITVTPEGTIILQTVGEIPVTGLTLEAAKRKVIAAVRQKYFARDVSFTLMTPRTFNVKVIGVGVGERNVNVLSTERADVAVSTATALEKEQTLKSSVPAFHAAGQRWESDSTVVASRRHIVVRHIDGSRSLVDLERYTVRRETRFNPLLREGDVVIVPRRDMKRDFVGVYGAVADEGVYEYVDGDSLLMMLRIARGVNVLADSTNVELWRSDVLAGTQSRTIVDIAAIASGETPDVPLQRGDRIVVREKESLRRNYHVRIEGEVKVPGVYPITKDSTKLTQVISFAGGFTPYAALNASSVYRKSGVDGRGVAALLETKRGIINPDDTAYYDLESRLRLERERVSVDFNALFVKDDSTRDVIMRDGDEIVIPSVQRAVYVFGQVVNPGYVVYAPGEGYRHYVAAAGGVTEVARDADIKIIKADTKQWLSPDETTIEPGDYIWVPKEPYRPLYYYLTIYGQVFSIIGTLATLAVLVVQLRK